MKIDSARGWLEAVELTRPYTIASRTIRDVDLFFVELRADNGMLGLGSASPAEEVTGESIESCRSALLDGSLEWLHGKDPRNLKALCEASAQALGPTPSAAAAVDMALHDLHARLLGRPLVDVLGRCHEALPTSITIGIKSVDEALEESDEYTRRGFRCLKIKLGHDFEREMELLAELRGRVGAAVRVRVDANQGYDVDETRRLCSVARKLDIELIEQPVPRESTGALLQLAASDRRMLAADESVHGPEDARNLARDPTPFGIFNIKLMKCGGITPALAIAATAELASLDLMWGCMDESVVSIAAALHAAYACSRTRYLDLDGSLDLARDPASGGFAIEDGMLRLLGEPGLGVRWC